MRIPFLVCVSLFAAVFARPALASDADPLQRSFAAGDYDAAARAGEAQGGSEALALAAQAWMAYCLTRAHSEEDIEAAAERAERAARAALESDPNSVDARLQLALALGVQGRRASTFAAIRAGYASEGLKLIREVLAREPADPWANALLGAWHFEVLRRGGAAGAKLFGASFEQGRAAFDQALTLAPDHAPILLLYAVGLIELDPERHAAQALALFERASVAPAPDAFAADMRAEAAAFAALLRKEGPQAAAARASARFS